MSVLLEVERVVVDWLLQDYRHRLVKQATQRAFRTFARQHPRWAASLFDEYFVMHCLLPYLIEAGQDGRASSEPEAPNPLVDPLRLAQKWADQMPGSPALRARQVRELVPVARRFLALLAAELAGNVPVAHARWVQDDWTRA